MTERDLIILSALVYKMGHPEHKISTALDFGSTFVKEVSLAFPEPHVFREKVTVPDYVAAIQDLIPKEVISTPIPFKKEKRTTPRLKSSTK